MKVDLTDIKALENREVEKRVPVDLVTFDSKLGKFPITKKKMWHSIIQERRE